MDRTPLLDEIAALLARHGQLLMDGDADGLVGLSEQLGRRLSQAAERRGELADKADLRRLQSLRNQAVVNLEMLSRREIAVRESLDALTPSGGRLGGQLASRVYVAAGGISKSTAPGRAFASA
jgi:hypothetical protein